MFKKLTSRQNWPQNISTYLGTDFRCISEFQNHRHRSQHHHVLEKGYHKPVLWFCQLLHLEHQTFLHLEERLVLFVNLLDPLQNLHGDCLVVSDRLLAVVNRLIQVLNRQGRSTYSGREIVDCLLDWSDLPLLHRLRWLLHALVVSLFVHVKSSKIILNWFRVCLKIGFVGCCGASNQSAFAYSPL